MCFYHKRKNQRDTKETIRGDGLSITLIMVMIAQVCTYIQSHQIVEIKYVQFSVYQLYRNKPV